MFSLAEGIVRRLRLALGLRPKDKPKPTLPEVSYGHHARNRLDLWKAARDYPTPVLIYMHGGGFIRGDKQNVHVQLLQVCLDAGISVASVNYRLIWHARYPGFMRDCARALQYVRFHAADWGIDPDAVMLCGTSSGGGIALWIAFHEDLSNQASADPVERESTRVASVATFEAQTSYDPRFIAHHVGAAPAQHRLLRHFYGLRGKELDSERAWSLFADASPIEHLTGSSPAAFLFYAGPDVPIPQTAGRGTGMHHPRFGIVLKRRMEALGLECRLSYGEPLGDDRSAVYSAMLAFLLRDRDGVCRFASAAAQPAAVES